MWKLNLQSHFSEQNVSMHDPALKCTQFIFIATRDVVFLSIASWNTMVSMLLKQNFVKVFFGAKCFVENDSKTSISITTF